MKATELRIGNYVLENGKDIVKVTHVIDNKVYTKSAGKQLITPIPATKSLLIKLGFEHIEKEDGFCIELAKGFAYLVLNTSDFSVAIHDNKKLKGVDYPCLVSGLTEYVHQVQNLYFALTNRELTLK